MIQIFKLYKLIFKWHKIFVILGNYLYINYIVNLKLKVDIICINYILFICIKNQEEYKLINIKMDKLYH